MAEARHGHACSAGERARGRVVNLRAANRIAPGLATGKQDLAVLQPSRCEDISVSNGHIAGGGDGSGRGIVDAGGELVAEIILATRHEDLAVFEKRHGGPVVNKGEQRRVGDRVCAGCGIVELKAPQLGRITRRIERLRQDDRPIRK